MNCGGARDFGRFAQLFDHRAERPGKVFWFFFSKKNCLPSLPSQLAQPSPDGPERVMAGEAGADDGVGEALLGAVGHLAGDDGGDLVGGHAATAADAGDLDGAGGGDDDDFVDAGLAVGFEQQGDVQDGEGGAGGAGAGEEAAFEGADHGVDDGFEAGERVGVVEDGAAEGGAVELAGDDGVGECLGDGWQGLAAGGLQGVDGGVGIEDGDVGAAECGGGGGLAHADAAG